MNLILTTGVITFFVLEYGAIGIIYGLAAVFTFTMLIGGITAIIISIKSNNEVHYE